MRPLYSVLINSIGPTGGPGRIVIRAITNITGYRVEPRPAANNGGVGGE